MELAPKAYGLNTRVKLKRLAPQHLAIIKLVKSRIIQKDAQKLIKIAEKIKSKNPAIKVSLICYANICSKSLELLQNNAIEVVFSDKPVG